MAYINLDERFLDHIKTARLRARLGLNADVYPIRFWLRIAAIVKDDGSVAELSAEEVEVLAGWTGEPGLCLAAMEAVGFIEKRPGGGYGPHDWPDHNGHIAAFKARGREGAKARWGSNASSNAPSNATSIASSNALTNLPTNLPANLPSKDSPALPEAFLAFYSAYPRKIGRPAALRAYRGLKMAPGGDVAVLEGLARWAAYWQAEGTPQAYIPHPSTFLNQRRWEDTPPPPKPRGKGAGSAVKPPPGKYQGVGKVVDV